MELSHGSLGSLLLKQVVRSDKKQILLLACACISVVTNYVACFCLRSHLRICVRSRSLKKHCSAYKGNVIYLHLPHPPQTSQIISNQVPPFPTVNELPHTITILLQPLHLLPISSAPSFLHHSRISPTSLTLLNRPRALIFFQKPILSPS